MPHEPASRSPAPICPDCAESMRIAAAERDKDHENLRHVIYTCDGCGRTSKQLISVAVRRSVMPSDAQKYKAKAAEFRLLAAQTADPFVKNLYFELAEEFEYLIADFKPLDDRRPGDEEH